MECQVIFYFIFFIFYYNNQNAVLTRYKANIPNTK